MKFLRLHDPLIGVLFENDDIVAVDKPYGIDSHTNEAKKGNEDFILPGLIELFEGQLGQKLHIVHRLDQTTTGVIVFGKSLESAKKYQQYFRARETQKTYVFVTAAKSKFDQASTDQTILHKGSELEASTDFKKIAASAKFEKWEASPHTGRNHQIRIHGAHVGLPLLGDTKYGGAEFPFLCLHNRRIEFPNGVVIESREPAYFEALNLLEERALACALVQIDRRDRLFKKADASQSYRLLHENRGTALDRLGPVLSLSWYQETWSPSDLSTYKQISGQQKSDLLVRLMSPKLKQKSGAPGEILIPNGVGQLPLVWIAQEADLKYELRTDTGQSLGLFTDQRLHRNWVRENAAGKRVLNLFSYTGAYSVAAAKGGASQVTSVDTSKAALNWLRRNLELNALPIEDHQILNRDSLQFLEQCVSKKLEFDLIVCDAPSFSRGDKGIFKLELEIDKLLALLLKVLAPKGHLLFATHHEALFVDDLRRKFEKAAPNCELSSIQSALDFELPGERVAMKSFLLQKF